MLILAAGALAVAVIPSLRDWSLESIGETTRLELIAWFGLGIVLGGVPGAIFAFNAAKSRSPDIPEADLTPPASDTPFEPLRVTDELHSLLWFVKMDPVLWLDDIPYPHNRDDVIDGPFHLNPSCLARLGTLYHGGDLVAERGCSRCKTLLYTRDFLDVAKAKDDVIEEIRRLWRVGQVEFPLALQHVGYWRTIQPPAKTATI